MLQLKIQSLFIGTCTLNFVQIICLTAAHTKHRPCSAFFSDFFVV